MNTLIYYYICHIYYNFMCSYIKNIFTRMKIMVVFKFVSTSMIKIIRFGFSSIIIASIIPISVLYL